METMIEIKKLSATVLLSMAVMAFAGCGGDEGGSENEDGEPSTRTVEHAMGESEVPEEPERVVSLDGASTDAMVAVGVEPVGVTTFTGTDFEAYEYMEDDLDGVEIVGQFVEPSLEAIVSLEPDLIVGSELSHEEIYDELSQIAPTVLMADTEGDFRRYARNVGEVLDMEEEAEERIAEYEANARDVAGMLEDAVGEESVAFLRATPDEYRLYGNGRLVGPILYGDLGLETPSYVEEVASDENYAAISLEEIPELDAEHVFLLDQTEGEIEELTENPLWQSVPAVEAENVYPAGRDTWIAIGIIASESMISDVEQALAQ